MFSSLLMKSLRFCGVIRDISSLRLKKVGIFWSARIGLRYRAVAKERPEDLVWIWIGRHDRYDEILKS
jgi:hypothetical protein